MSKIVCPVTWVACRAVQSYVIPVTGNYVITAAGAQGGAGACLGGRGARVEGLFYLREREVVTIVVGQQGGAGGNPTFAPDQTACGGGGGGASYVWKSTSAGAMPPWPLLVAAGGGGGGQEEGGDGQGPVNPPGTLAAGGPAYRATPGETGGHFGGGGGLGWFVDGPNGPGPIYCRGGTRWTGGEGVAYGFMQGGHGGYGGGGGGGFLGYASGGGAGFEGGAGGGQLECQLDRVRRSGGGTSYNSGRNQVNTGGVQTGDGFVTISAVPPGELVQIKAPDAHGAVQAVDFTRRQPGAPR